jgi:hypothetical protein
MGSGVGSPPWPPGHPIHPGLTGCDEVLALWIVVGGVGSAADRVRLLSQSDRATFETEYGEVTVLPRAARGHIRLSPDMAARSARADMAVWG